MCFFQRLQKVVKEAFQNDGKIRLLIEPTTQNSRSGSLSAKRRFKNICNNFEKDQRSLIVSCTGDPEIERGSELQNQSAKTT